MRLTPPPSIALPPLYVDPVPLDVTRHGDWRLLAGDAAFAAEALVLPIMVNEFAQIAPDCPILFAGQDVSPVALMGLEQVNLFIEDGQWVEDAHVPAYVRRYPFIQIETPENKGFVLGVDAASPMLIKPDGGRDSRRGAPLFEAGEPARVTRLALELCRLFAQDHLRTRLFCKTLEEANILVERRAEVASADGRKLAVNGFKAIDLERFMALPDATVLSWHRQGVLALAHHHLASLGRIKSLLARHERRVAKAR